jgi:hypothetical protein
MITGSGTDERELLTIDPVPDAVVEAAKRSIGTKGSTPGYRPPLLLIRSATPTETD